MKKRILSILLTLAILLSCISAFGITSNAGYTTSEGQLPFTDISFDAWYYESAEFCYINGIINGQGNTYTFAPNVTLTRATFVVMLGRVLDADLSYYTYSSFTDCPVGEWYTASVEWAAGNGYVNGTGNNKFSPNASITREQAAVMFSRILEKQGYVISVSGDILSSYKDGKNVSDWAKNGVMQTLASGLIGSTNSNYSEFSPHMTMTRAQAAKMFTSLIREYLSAKCKHDYKDATCTKGMTCRKCGIVESLPTGHYCNYLSCDNGDNCINCGLYIDALGHTTTMGVCGRCGQEVFSSDYKKVSYYMVQHGTAGENYQKYYLINYMDYSDGDSDYCELIYYPSSASFDIYYLYEFADGDYVYITIGIPGVLSSYNVQAVYIDAYYEDILYYAEGTVSTYTQDFTCSYYDGSSSNKSSFMAMVDQAVENAIFHTDIMLNNLCGESSAAFGF
ncbi:MAG: S-layer homology domain-containing protein [Clostridia bacterium]|nr:S-layer homology domain-containing protein [Clostridia bacterium]